MSHLPRIPRAPAAASGIKPVTTPGTPVSVTAPTAPAAGPPSPAKTDPVLASRANPPPTIGKLTEKKIVSLFGLCKNVYGPFHNSLGRKTAVYRSHSSL